MAKLSDAAWRLDLAAYPHVIEMRGAYTDVDSNQHLNNVAFARFFDEGRAAMNMTVFGEDAIVRPSPAQQLLYVTVAIEYLAEGRYPGLLTVGTAISRIGGSSFGEAGGLFQDGRCIALCEAVNVFARNGRPEKLPADIAGALKALQPKT